MSVYDDVKSQFGYTVPNQIWAHSDAGMKLIGCYNSGNFSERYTKIPLGSRVCVAQVLVPDAQAGDVVVAMADSEITSSRDTNTEIVTQLLWASGSGSITGDEISEENGSNVDINEHHKKLVSTGSVVVPSSRPLSYVSFVVGAFDGSIQPQYVVVETDYTRVAVLHFRVIR